eukprot:TRINITY_DN6702_c0_g1_i2.p1 TRINITY_DN6702_c0_g1~~TRINITY_DN6702_c0_g1_i2.p1  ORF type:complete len:181 (+),score=74.37 TRINITY_DN6702_c0_g1_i2:625-1167(+)
MLPMSSPVTRSPLVHDGQTFQENNPFLEDRALWKTLRYSAHGTVTVTGSPPRWKGGQAPTPATKTVTDKDGTKRQKRVGQESFFKWFEEDVKEQSVVEFADEVADVLKEDLWPNPLRFFTQEGDEEDEEELAGEDESDDEDDGEEDDAEEEEEEDEEDEAEAAEGNGHGRGDEDEEEGEG